MTRSLRMTANDDPVPSGLAAPEIGLPASGRIMPGKINQQPGKAVDNAVAAVHADNRAHGTSKIDFLPVVVEAGAVLTVAAGRRNDIVGVIDTYDMKSHSRKTAVDAAHVDRYAACPCDHQQQLVTRWCAGVIQRDVGAVHGRDPAARRIRGDELYP